MKISVIVPVYNVEKYLRFSLDSLVNQTFEDYEIILVNDGSTDSSSYILNEYLEKYPDKIVVLNKENGGQASARNYALKFVRGKYVMFVDSDDYIDKNTLKITYDKAIETSSDIVCFKNYEVINGKVCDSNTPEIKADDNMKTYILNHVGPCFKLIKTELITKNNLSFPILRAYEDLAVIPALGIFAKDVTFIDDKLYYYIIREGSTMKQTVYSEKLEHIFPALENLFNIFKKNNMYEKYYTELEFMYVKYLLHDASLRFIAFDNYKENINKIILIINEYFPNWRKNIYYKKCGLKYHIVCELLYRKKIKILKKILKR